MPAVRCPKCRFPLSHDESRCGTCPFCGAVLEGVVAAPSAPVESPLPVDERVTGSPRSRSAAPFAWAAGVLAGLALGGGGLYYLLSAGIPIPGLCPLPHPASRIPVLHILWITFPQALFDP